MKAYLFVLLLAIAFCSDVAVTTINPLDVIACLVKNQVIVDVVTQLVTAVLAQDWAKAGLIALQNYLKVIDAVKGCLPALA